MNGEAGNDVVAGDAGDDLVFGQEGDDVLTGGAGADTLRGGADVDRLTGGSEADLFQYVGPGDSGLGSGQRDVIADFQQGLDRIDPQFVDAKAGIGGDRAFEFKSGNAFTGEGQVRVFFEGDRTVVALNTIGTGGAEAQIELAGRIALSRRLHPLRPTPFLRAPPTWPAGPPGRPFLCFASLETIEAEFTARGHPRDMFVSQYCVRKCNGPAREDFGNRAGNG